MTYKRRGGRGTYGWKGRTSQEVEGERGPGVDPVEGAGSAKNMDPRTGTRLKTMVWRKKEGEGGLDEAHRSRTINGEGGSERLGVTSKASRRVCFKASTFSPQGDRYSSRKYLCIVVEPDPNDALRRASVINVPDHILDPFIWTPSSDVTSGVIIYDTSIAEVQLACPARRAKYEVSRLLLAIVGVPYGEDLLGSGDPYTFKCSLRFTGYRSASAPTTPLAVLTALCFGDADFPGKTKLAALQFSPASTLLHLYEKVESLTTELGKLCEAAPDYASLAQVLKNFDAELSRCGTSKTSIACGGESIPLIYRVIAYSVILLIYDTYTASELLVPVTQLGYTLPLAKSLPGVARAYDGGVELPPIPNLSRPAHKTFLVDPRADMPEQ